MRYVLLALFLTVSCVAETLSGRIVGVTDGDTVTLLTPENRQMKIRLYGIDAPEARQAFGTRARQALSSMVFSKDAKAEVRSTDRYGRTVAWLYVDGGNINEAMVQQGFAWWYQSFAKKDTRLEELQNEAKAARRGLWSDKAPVPPWEWRKKVPATSSRQP